MIEVFEGTKPRVSPLAWVHPMATVIGDVEVGDYTTIWPAAVLRGDFGPIRIGARTSVQDGTVVHSAGTGTYIGSACTIGHQAFLEEAVVEDGCLIGVGARVLNGVKVGRGSVVAAGAVLVKTLQVPAGSRVQGIPARIVGHAGRSDEQIEADAGAYVAMIERYRA